MHFLINLSSAVRKLEKVDWDERYPINSLLLLAAMHAQRMCIQPDFFFIKPGFHMSGKSQTIGAFTFCRPSQIYRIIATILSLILPMNLARNGK